MITYRQFDIKNQYSPQRNKSRYHRDEAGGSLHRGKPSQIQNNSNLKPLQEGAQAQISFKGLSFASLKKAFKPSMNPIPESLTNRVFKSLESISKEQHEYYSKIRDKYIVFIKENANFREKNGISKEIAETISENKLYYLPKKSILNNFINQIIAPIKFVYEKAEKIIRPKNSKKVIEMENQAKILKEFASLEGLIKSHEIWENLYRKMSGNPKWNKNNKFLIPDDVLLGKINRRRNKVVDPNKGKYSTTSLMLGNRLISGVVYSYFLGADAYNTTMRYSNDKHEASSQRKSRIKQEFSRIGMNMYIQNLLFGTFEAAVNRSMPTALFLSGSTAAFSEILGRKLVGKPIMPSDKKTLDRLENEMSEKKGILPAVGRLLTNVKKKDNTIKSIKSDFVTYEKTEPSKTLLSAFGGKKTSSDKPSFKGYFKSEKLFERKNLAKVIAMVEEADSMTGQNFKKVILKAANKSEYIEKAFKELKLNPPQSFDDLINNEKLKNIPIGEQETLHGTLTKSVFTPVKFIKNIFVSTGKSISNLYKKLTNKKNNIIAKDLDNLIKSGNEKDIEKFNDFHLKRLNLDVWKESSLNAKDKKLRIFSEFKEIQEKDEEDIKGVKNILLWIDKQIKKEKIEIQSNGQFKEEDIEKIRKIMKDSVLKADGAKHAEYDGNKISQTNINLARAITTLFLVTDAYNLTMQYSNDNKKDANKSAKNRAAQEISRIGLSAYMLSFFHTLLSKMCNSSLGGAFALTTLTSSVNDSISRKVVGVPLSAKSQAQLQEIDKENSKSKSPIKKALAYSLGKKSALPQQAVKSTEMDCFKNDFFIKPEIV